MKVLRAVAAMVAVVWFGGGTAYGQFTTLKINGATSATNSATVDVAIGSTMTIEISNSTLANRPYGLFGANAKSANPSGWFLAVAAGPKNPYPFFTGVDTSIVVADYGVAITPSRTGNPRIKLDATGKATITMNVASTIANNTVIFVQAAVLESSGTSTDFSNGIQVTFKTSVTASRMLISRSTTSANAVEFGVTKFTGGDPKAATYAVASNVATGGTFTNMRPDGIAIATIAEWTTRSKVTGSSNDPDKAREVRWAHTAVDSTPALNNENHEYASIQLPATDGRDGIHGNGDDLPPRKLLRCYDVTTSQGYFMVVNQGVNPNDTNTPKLDFFEIPGTRKTDVTTPSNNGWKSVVIVSPDGTRAAAVFDDSSATVFPQLFLFATDQSLPYKNSGGTDVATVDVTPTGTQNIGAASSTRAAAFTDNFLWFARDTGSNADSGTSGGDTRNDQTLFSVDIRQTNPKTSPVAKNVSIPINPNYTTMTLNAVVDSIADRSFLVPNGGGDTVCFLAGDTFTAASGILPDFIQRGDWYAVKEANPTLALNITKFGLYGPTTPFTTQPKMAVAGDGYSGLNGGASISPDGSRLAFFALLSKENGTTAGEDDELYICKTDGSEAGQALFDAPVTLNTRIDSKMVTNSLDDGIDVYFVDNNSVIFFYGDETTSPSARGMDLFHWNQSTLKLTNISRPGLTGAALTTLGTVNPEGIFTSPNGRYLYFARGINGDAQTNLHGVDLMTLKEFNVTGKDIAAVPQAAEATKPFNTVMSPVTPLYGENYFWHLSFAGGSFPSLCYFSTPNVTTAPLIGQVFVFDANYPTVAIQLTADTGSTITSVESLTGSPVSLGCAWSWCLGTATTGSTGATPTSNLMYQDLLYYFRDSLIDPTTTFTFTSATTLGAIQFVRAAISSDPTGAAPPAVIVAIGNAAQVADNPTTSEFYYFSINGTSNYDFDATTSVDAPGHQVATTAISGGPLTGFIQIFHADVK